MFSTVIIRSCARQVGRSLTKNRSSVKGCGKSYSTTTYSHAMRAGKTYTDAKVVFSTIALGSGLIIGTSTLLNRRFPKIAIAEEERPTLLKSHEMASKADALYKQEKFEELYKALSEYNKRISNNPEALWRNARAAYELAKRTSDSSEKKRLVYESHDLALKALEYDKNNYMIHKWIGISLSEITNFEGPTSQIEKSFIIKEHFETACKLNPNDPYGHYLIGKWRWTFADMSWYMRKIASALFATPPESSYEEALKAFLQAESVQSGFYLDNRVMIAKAYYKLGDMKNAKHWCQFVLSEKPKTPYDEEAIKEAKDLMYYLPKD